MCVFFAATAVSAVSYYQTLEKSTLKSLRSDHEISALLLWQTKLNGFLLL